VQDLTTEKGYKSNYRKLFGSVLCDNTGNALQGGAILVAFALFLGLDEYQIGIFLALKVAFYCVAILSASVFARIGQSKKSILTVHFLYRLSLYLTLFIPFITQDTTMRFAMFVTLLSLQTIFAHINYSPIVNWRMQVLKKDDAKKFFAQKNFLVEIFAIGIYFITSALLDKYTGTNFIYWVFFGYFSIIMFLFAVELFLRICLYKPPVTEKSKITTIQVFTLPIKNRQSRSAIIFATITYFAVDIGMLFMAIYQIKYLGYSFVFIAILLCFSKLSSAFGGMLWNRVACKKQDYKLALVSSCILIFISFVCLALIGGMSIYIMALLFVMFGIGGSGIELYRTNAIYESAPDGMKVATLSCSKFWHGIVGIIIAIISIIFVKENNNEITIRIFFAVASVGMLVCLLYLTFTSKKTNK
jgi:uncharacterized integral membrane protein